MRFFVAVTDNDWFNHLSDLQPDEVNFWRPSGQLFKSVDAGAPLLFKLHSPLNYIVGGGFFIRSERLPMSVAWNVFGEKNGAPDLSAFQRIVKAHRSNDEHDPQIGCVILNEPFFFPQDKWLPVPPDWARNIVAGKTYDSNDPVGRELWEQAAQLISEQKHSNNESEIDLAEGSRFGNEYLARGRLGQGAFGILLRSDLHILFDRGYLTVTPDQIVEVSRKIKDEYKNGKEYYSFHGRPLQTLPDLNNERPHGEHLQWHNENIYLG